jgi:hypothetical protein
MTRCEGASWCQKVNFTLSSPKAIPLINTIIATPMRMNLNLGGLLFNRMTFPPFVFYSLLKSASQFIDPSPPFCTVNIAEKLLSITKIVVGPAFSLYSIIYEFCMR